MNYPPRRPGNSRERVIVPLDHAALTASAVLDIFAPSQPFVVTAVDYFNLTGLAEDPTNSFAVTVKNASTPLVVADKVFTAANASEIFTSVAHGMLTGDGPVQVSNSGGALPTGLVAATNYWVIKITADTFYLAASFANAMAGTNLAISTDGTGTQTLSDVATTSRLTTVASGIDTDSDNAGTNTLVAGRTALTMTATTADRLIDTSQRLVAVFTKGGTQTLPTGRLVVEGYYV